MKRAPVLLLTFTCLATFASAQAGADETADLSIGRIVLGQAESDVLRTLGPPLSRKVEEGYYELSMRYEGLSVYFTGGAVDWVSSSSTNYCLNSGVCPGQQYTEALRILGVPDSTRSSGTDSFEARFLTESDCWILVDEAAGIVQSVQLKCPT